MRYVSLGQDEVKDVEKGAAGFSYNTVHKQHSNFDR